jgi:hypothetical protein
VIGIPFTVFFPQEGFKIPGERDCQAEVANIISECDPGNPLSGLAHLNATQDTIQLGRIEDPEIRYPNLELCISMAQQQNRVTDGFYQPAGGGCASFWKTHELDNPSHADMARKEFETVDDIQALQKSFNPKDQMQLFHKKYPGLVYTLTDMACAKAFYDLVMYLRGRGATHFGIRFGALQGGQFHDSIPASWLPSFVSRKGLQGERKLIFHLHTGIIAQWNESMQNLYCGFEAINPKTAKPVVQKDLEVYVSHPDPFQAISHARAMYCMGKELAYATALRQGTAALIIYGPEPGQFLMTESMQQLISLDSTKNVH